MHGMRVCVHAELQPATHIPLVVISSMLEPCAIGIPTSSCVLPPERSLRSLGILTATGNWRYLYLL